MPSKKSKVKTLQEAVQLIRDGDSVAIGGHTFRRHPMALVYEIIRQRKKNLTLLGWNNANDMDVLIGAGCVKEIETSYVGMSMFGLAPNFRRAVEKDGMRVYDHSETTAIDMFRAQSLGLDFLPTKAPLATGMMKTNPRFKEITCPFTGEKYAAVRAANPDAAIIHAHFSDRYGNVGLDTRRLMENEMDAIIAKSAKTVIVSVEQIVSDEFVKHNAHLTFVPGVYVDAVVEAPFGAHPTACDSRYDYDLEHLEAYCAAARDHQKFQAFLDEYVYGVHDHWGYLNKLGMQYLTRIKRQEGIHS